MRIKKFFIKVILKFALIIFFIMAIICFIIILPLYWLLKILGFKNESNEEISKAIKEQNKKLEQEFKERDQELKNKVNKGFKICCPSCHSQEYSVYPTGSLTVNVAKPEEDIHWICNNCKYVWNSEFCGQKYGYKKSSLEGRIVKK